MCDKLHYEKLEDRVTDLEKTDVRHDEKINNIERAIKWQAITVWGAFLLCLLALIYGALGPKGFNAVSETARIVNNTKGE